MDLKKFIHKMMPRSMAGQVIAILAISFTALLTAFAIEEISEHEEGALEWVLHGRTLYKLAAMKPILDTMEANQRDKLFVLTASCHSGFSVTDKPYSDYQKAEDTENLKLQLARKLELNLDDLLVGRAKIRQKDFIYGRCRRPEGPPIAEGMLISIRLQNGQWFTTEVHHHWHFNYIVDWLTRTGGLFLFIGIVSVVFIRKITHPLGQLTTAAQQFGDGLKVSKLDEAGPPDLRRAAQAFNAMQQQVMDEVKKRTDTLAAISHDVRTPLTALRIKAELIDDIEVRQDLITSIDRMEKITASALEFLKGESRGEPLRNIDLSALLESECHDFEEMGYTAKFIGENKIHQHCRPEALARAVRNLIENAVKYAGSVEVKANQTDKHTLITVVDSGPGIPADKLALAVEPFERLSKARESNQGGFGLGLSVAKAIAEGHDGTLILEANKPSGLIATIRLSKS